VPVMQQFSWHPVPFVVAAAVAMFLVRFLDPSGFVSLTVLLNSAQVLLLPLLAVAVWILTASPRFIGDRHVNRPWENTGMALFLGAALLGAFGTGLSLLRALGVAL